MDRRRIADLRLPHPRQKDIDRQSAELLLATVQLTGSPIANRRAARGQVSERKSSRAAGER